jgi:hypothetical protein
MFVAPQFRTSVSALTLRPGKDSVLYDIEERNQHEVDVATCFMLISCLHYSLTLQIEAIRSSDTSIVFEPLHGLIPEDRTLHSDRCESLKSCFIAT